MICGLLLKRGCVERGCEGVLRGCIERVYCEDDIT